MSRETRETHRRDSRQRLASALLTLIVALGGLGASTGATAEDWYRVESSDGRASVLFPNPADEFRELVDKTPGGKVVTRVAEHQADGILMTISATRLPLLAGLAGSDLIFTNAKNGVLSKAYGTELSSHSFELPGADAAIVMRYEAPELEQQEHPGYSGLAIFAIVGRSIYVVNSALSKHTPENEAMQQKLLGSLAIEGE